MSWCRHLDVTRGDKFPENPAATGVRCNCRAKILSTDVRPRTPSAAARNSVSIYSISRCVQAPVRLASRSRERPFCCPLIFLPFSSVHTSICDAGTKAPLLTPSYAPSGRGGRVCQALSRRRTSSTVGPPIRKSLATGIATVGASAPKKGLDTPYTFVCAQRPRR